MGDLEQRFEKEAECFDTISSERKRNNQIPDMRKTFSNHYFYNNIWRDSRFLQAEFGPYVQWMLKLLKEANVDKVLELGSGIGFVSLELAREGFDVTGLDLSQGSIKIAQEYLDSLPEKKDLSLKYVYQNVMDLQDYSGESVICFGFLHHLPLEVLSQVVGHVAEKMNPGQMMLVAAEPRYDKASYEMAVLLYSLRLALPNHFQYENIQDNMMAHIKDIHDELAEKTHDQSEMDDESSSEVMLKVLNENFSNVETSYSTSFFDKIIGGIRVDAEDTAELVTMLKRFDEMILKYNPGFARAFMIKAIKE